MACYFPPFGSHNVRRLLLFIWSFAFLPVLLFSAGARSAEATPALTFQTPLGGGSGFEWAASAIAFDSDGNMFVAGNSGSPDFPLVNSLQAVPVDRDLFVAKFDPSGRQLLFSTFLGGVGAESVSALAVDAEGNLYIAGTALAAFQRLDGTDELPGKLPPGFPTTAGVLQEEVVLVDCDNGVSGAPACSSVFVAKLAADGSKLLFSTFVGGNASNAAFDLALLSNGRVAVVGETRSSGFPQTVTEENLAGGGTDGFVAVLSADGAELEYSALIGGSAFDSVSAVAVDSADRLFLAGATDSANFPVRSALRGAIAGPDVNADGFLGRLQVGGEQFDWATFVGGSDADSVVDIALGSADSVHLVGNTLSADLPVVQAAQPSYAGLGDIFVAQVSAAGDAYLYSSYLGGPGDDQSVAIATTQDGKVLLAGSSHEVLVGQPFPQINPVLEADFQLGAVAARFDPSSQTFDYATFLGEANPIATASGPNGYQWVVGAVNDSVRLPLVNPLSIGTADNGFFFSFGSTPFISRIADQTPAAISQLSLTQSPLRFLVEEGGVQEVTVTLSNDGQSVAQEIVVAQTMGSALQLGGAQPEAGAYDVVNRIWTLDSLAPGASVNLRLSIITGEPVFGATPLIASVVSNSEPLDITPLNNLVVGQAAIDIEAHQNSFGLQAAILPSARSVQVGTKATVFASLLYLPVAAINCRVAPQTPVPATFEYTVIDSVTNEPIAAPNVPGVSFGFGNLIPMNFVLTMTPFAEFPPTAIEFEFSCDNFSLAAPAYPGLNDLVLSSSASPQPDLVAVAATVGNTGVLALDRARGFTAFAVATTNVGAPEQIVVRASTGGADLGLDLRMCETDPLSGQCINPLIPSVQPVTTNVDAGATPTFAVFARRTRQALNSNEFLSRIYMQFEGPGGELRGATSVAIR